MVRAVAMAIGAASETNYGETRWRDIGEPDGVPAAGIIRMH